MEHEVYQAQVVVVFVVIFAVIDVVVQLQMSAGSLKVAVEQYNQLSLKCWAKFYCCCLEYQQLACKPVALFRDASTGVGVVVKLGLLSFLRPVHQVECLDTDLALEVEGKDRHALCRFSFSCRPSSPPPHPLLVLLSLLPPLPHPSLPPPSHVGWVCYSPLHVIR